MEVSQNNEAAEMIEDEADYALPEADDIAVELAPENRKRGVEAIVFAAPTPVAVSHIAQQLKLENDDVQNLLNELQQDYSDRGVHLVERAGHWSFQTAVDLAPHLSFIKTRPAKLSRAAMETLAVVAYHQPLTRSEIENIRGIAVHRGTLDILLETGWIKPGKRREIPGRPLTWVTTDAFLEHFGLIGLKDLPGVAELKSSGLLDRRPAIALVPERDDVPESETPDTPNDADDLSDFLPDDMSSRPQRSEELGSRDE